MLNIHTVVLILVHFGLTWNVKIKYSMIHPRFYTSKNGNKSPTDVHFICDYYHYYYIFLCSLTIRYRHLSYHDSDSQIHAALLSLLLHFIINFYFCSGLRSNMYGRILYRYMYDTTGVYTIARVVVPLMSKEEGVQVF